jgi:hypothetical protein
MPPGWVAFANSCFCQKEGLSLSRQHCADPCLHRAAATALGVGSNLLKEVIMIPTKKVIRMLELALYFLKWLNRFNK